MCDGQSALREFSREVASDHLPAPSLSLNSPTVTDAALLPHVPLSPQWILSLLNEMRTSLWLRGGKQLTNDGKKGGVEGAQDGIKKREGGILCNGVENTKDRQTHAFVIFVSLRPLPHPQQLPFCLWFPVSLFSWSSKPSLFCFTFRVK